ncbi:MAG: lamin tail domain-containing protein, partial [Ignavibacteria bacterium]|nr:lamin tail domain-containing protein [Ignavibacteria bacterium]
MKSFIIVLIIMLVSASNSFSQISINEIMFAPADASNEWFEIYNTGNTSVNLQNWKWKDATATLRTITNQTIIFSSNEYLIICQDSVKLKNLYSSLSGVFIQTLWSALNNTGDNLILIDQNNNRIDSVSFLSTWGGNTGGYSLERKIVNGNSNTVANWGTSIDPLKATPDKLNSITPKPYDLYLKSLLVEPIFPSKGDTLKLNFNIKNTGINSAGNFSLNIYNDINFDSSASNNELINTKSFTNLNPEDSLNYSYRILNIDTGSKKYIAKINYESDND